MNRTINELKSSHLLDEKIATDLLNPKAKTPQFKMFKKKGSEKFKNRGSLVDQWSVLSAAILQRFRDTLIISYSPIKRTQVKCQRPYRFHTENHQLGKNSCNHGCAFSIHKYSKEGKKLSYGNKPEKKKI